MRCSSVDLRASLVLLAGFASCASDPADDAPPFARSTTPEIGRLVEAELAHAPSSTSSITSTTSIANTSSTTNAASAICPDATPGAASAAPSHTEPAPQSRAGSTLLDDPAALLERLSRHDPALAAQRAKVEQARSALDQAGLHPDPTLTSGLGGALGARNPSDLSWKDTSSWNLGLQESFEIGKRAPRIAAARLRLDEEQLTLADAAADRAHLARAALARELYLRQRLALMNESVSGAREMLEVERGRLQHGDMSSNDFDRLTLDTALLEIDVPKTESEHAAALADVHALLGEDCPLAEAGPESLARAAELPPIADLEEVLAARADHRALELERRASGEDAALARARRIPDPELGLSFTHDDLTVAGDQPNSLQLSLGVRLPIFDRGQHDARRAEAREREVEQQLEGSLRDALAQARSLLARREALSAVLARLDGEALPKSRQVLEASTVAFNRGQISLTDVLLTRRTHTELQLREVDLAFEAFDARNDLRHVLGVDAELFLALDRGSRP